MTGGSDESGDGHESDDREHHHGHDGHHDWTVVMACGSNCPYKFDGDCDDGGPGASYHMCSIGEDCADCGTRPVLAAPPPPPSPPAPLISHVPLTLVLLLAWCFASMVARGLRARQIRQIRELVASGRMASETSPGTVAVAVPVATVVGGASAEGAAAGASGGSGTGEERHERDAEQGGATHADGAGPSDASAGVDQPPPPVVVQGTRVLL